MGEEMAKCAFCGVEVVLPFKCSYCGQLYCVMHRLPEGHNCQRIIEVRRPELIERAGSTPKLRVEVPFKIRLPKTSMTEVKHLAIAVAIFFLIMASLPRFIALSFKNPYMLIILFIATLSTFILHELAHKLVAQAYGYWSEFRLHIPLALLSLLSIISPIKIIAPGAVVVHGYFITRESEGKIAAAGPMVNIAQAFISIALSPLNPNLFYLFEALNTYLAFFNLLPLSILDGRKVFDWSKGVWALTFILTLVLMARSLIIKSF